MQKFLLLFSCLILYQACTKDCCFDGNPITDEEALDILEENESGDSIIIENVNTVFKCLNGNEIKNLSIIIRDASNEVVDEIIGDSEGFDFPVLENGTYAFQFVNNNLPSYTTAQWDDIITRVTEIFLSSGSPPTNIEKLAYNIVNFNDGITSFDRVIFENLKNGGMDIGEIDFPWRYVLTSELDVAESITDSILVEVESGKKIELEITPIYIGDTIGQFCN